MFSEIFLKCAIQKCGRTLNPCQDWSPSTTRLLLKFVQHNTIRYLSAQKELSPVVFNDIFILFSHIS